MTAPKRFFQLFMDQQANRWSYTSTATNATNTAQVSPNVKNAVEIHHMDFFQWVVKNLNTLDFTVAAQVRDASATGTVLAQWPMVLKGSQVAQVSASDVHQIATKGKSFFFTTDTVQPSVTSTVNAAGWIDTGQSY